MMGQGLRSPLGVRMTESFAAEGGCDCAAARYRMTRRPLFVHCCHCRWCQRETGSAFALNAMIESESVELTHGATEKIWTPSESGRGQQIVRCRVCRIALWSYYGGSGDKVKFLRVGTLDDPDLLPPDVHIYTASKQPWVALDPRTPSFEAYYDWKSLWPAESQERRRAMNGAPSEDAG